MNQLSRVPPGADPVVTVQPRSRPRLIDTTPEGKPEWHMAVEGYVKANAAKNAATREEGAAKKTLERLMATAGDKRLTHVVDGATYTVTFEEGEADSIDTEALFKMVDLPTFLSIVSVSASAVKTKCGSIVAAAVTKTRPTEASLKIAKQK